MMNNEPSKDVVAERVAEILKGTCTETVESALTQLEAPLQWEGDTEFCLLLDNHVFLCERCNWWCSQDENRGNDSGWWCEDCDEGEDDDDGD